MVTRLQPTAPPVLMHTKERWRVRPTVRACSLSLPRISRIWVRVVRVWVSNRSRGSTHELENSSWCGIAITQVIHAAIPVLGFLCK